jgi:DNA-binding MarR family transcriptional regulator
MKYYDPKNFRSRDSLGYLSKMAHTLMHDCADQILSAHDVSFLQWIAMRKLREGTALTASDLCREMRHDNGALTRMLDQLEERGYLARERSEQDRRVVELQLTRSGDRKLDELTPLIVEKLNLALGDFSRAEFDELTRLMKKLIDNLQRVQASGGAS